VEELLRGAGLPVPAPDDPEVHFVVIADEDGVAACAGWETYGELALVRSVAVRKRSRGQGLGRRVVEAVLRALEDLRVRDVTLVTIDAAAFFRPLGFEAIERAEVPGPVRASPEFRIHDCASGQWMRRR